MIKVHICARGVTVTYRHTDLDYYIPSVCVSWKDVFMFVMDSRAQCNDVILITAYQLCNAVQRERERENQRNQAWNKSWSSYYITLDCRQHPSGLNSALLWTLLRKTCGAGKASCRHMMLTLDREVQQLVVLCNIRECDGFQRNWDILVVTEISTSPIDTHTQPISQVQPLLKDFNVLPPVWSSIHSSHFSPSGCIKKKKRKSRIYNYTFVSS